MARDTAMKYKETCIYCGGDVYYSSGQQLIRCGWCGNTLKVAKFENELFRMQQTEEENALVKQQLAQAKQDKQAADDRLFVALSALGNIESEQDTLGKMLHLLTDKQENALDQVQLVKGISEQLINSQDDIFARMGVMNEIAAHLQKIEMDTQARQSMMNEFIVWSQQIRQEDVLRLQDIKESAEGLLAGQKEINQRVQELQNAADRHQKALEAFHGEYIKDKLEELRQLYHQAASFQRDRSFDKAEEYYRKVLTKGGEDVEVYWRLLMCHYGLTYQKDDKGRQIPIILKPDLTDPAQMSLRRSLMQHMEALDQAYYQAELAKIDQILDKYRQLKDQMSYDVFISVKQNDKEGHYTPDSDVASDLYDFLEDQGLRVFNSRRTIIPAGQEYEPYIISALMSAKAMIVVGTNQENMNAQWVKNEWSRYQWLQYREKELTGRIERVLICYLARGMRAEQIPRALNPNRQAVLEGVKAHNQLLAALGFLLKTKRKEQTIYQEKEDTQNDYDRLINQMTTWLYLGKYEKVSEKYDQLTEEGLYLTKAQFHLSALCAKKKVADIQEVVCSEIALDQIPLYKLAVRLCQDEGEKQQLEKLLVQNREWNNKAGKSAVGKVQKVVEVKKEKSKALENHQKEMQKAIPTMQPEKTVVESSVLQCPDWQHINAGDHVAFGTYDNVPITWRVLENDQKEVLLITDKAIDSRRFHESHKRVTWETCSLRKWLNTEFLQKAFSEEERNHIVSSTVENHKNPRSGTNPGNATTDQIFLLSAVEAEKYFQSNEDRECLPTEHAQKNGGYNSKGSNACWWWLRTPGTTSLMASLVESDGTIGYIGYLVKMGVYGVRPVLRVAIAP